MEYDSYPPPQAMISCLEISMDVWALVTSSYNGRMLVGLAFSGLGQVPTAAVSSWLQQSCYIQKIAFHSISSHLLALTLFLAFFFAILCSLSIGGGDIDIMFRDQHFDQLYVYKLTFIQL